MWNTNQRVENKLVGMDVIKHKIVYGVWNVARAMCVAGNRWV